MADKINYKKTTISGLIWRFLDKAGGQIITTVVSVILARLLGPKAYGEIALTTIFITICNVFVTSGFGSALIQKKNADELDYSSVFYSGFGISLILYAVLFVASPYIAEWLNVPVVSPVLRVIGLKLPIAALGTVQNAYVNKHFMFRSYFYVTLIANILSGIVGIVMAFLGYGVWALVAKEMVYIVIGKIVLFFLTKWYPKFMFSWKRTRSLLKFSWKLLCSGLLDVAYNQATGFIIGGKYSTEDLAFYNKGKSWPAMIIDNVNSPINGVLFPVLAQAQNDDAKMKNIVRRSIKTSGYVIFPMLAGLAAIAPMFVAVILGVAWMDSVPFMMIMCFVLAFDPMSTANLLAIMVKGRSDIFLKLEIAKKVMGVAIIFATLWFGPIWLAVGMMGETIFGVIVNLLPNKKLFGYSLVEQFKDIVPYIVMALVMAVPVYAMNYLNLTLGWNKYAVFVMQMVVGVALYVGISKIFKVEMFDYLLKTIKEYIHKKRNGVPAPKAQPAQITMEPMQKAVERKPILQMSVENRQPILNATVSGRTTILEQSANNRQTILAMNSSKKVSILQAKHSKG